MTQLLNTPLVNSGYGFPRVPEYFEKVMSIQPNYAIGYPLYETDLTRRCREASERVISLDLAGNGGFETAGGGGADVFAFWTESVGDGAIVDEGVIVHGGAHAAKLTAGAAINTYIRPSEKASGSGISAGEFRVKPGAKVTISFWTRGTGTYAGRWSLYNISQPGFIIPTKSTDVPGAVYQQVTQIITVPTDCWLMQVALLCPSTNGGIAYFDDFSFTVETDLDARYSSTGILLAQSNFTWQRTAIHADGNNSHIWIGDQFFNSVANMNVGSLIAWGIVDDWDEIASARYLWHIKSEPDATWYIVEGKNNAFVRNIFWRRRTGGAIYEVSHSPFNPVGWFCMGMVWDVVSVPKRIACWVYTLATDTLIKVSDAAPGGGMGDALWDKATYPVWGGNTVLLAGSTSAQEFIGSASNHYYWPGIVLTDAEMEEAMTP